MQFKDLFRKKSIPQLIADADERAAHGNGGMVKNLNVRDLTAMGIAAVVGAGIFSTVGKACFDGGPAISLLYIFTAVACLFSALCYAEFASRVPISGSAYTYAYTTFGELIAWIIGWNLVFEYAIGNITVAISWSQYFISLLEKGLHIHIPAYFQLDYVSAWRAANDPTGLAAQDIPAESIQLGATAWTTAPQFMGLRIIANLPTLLLTFLISWLIITGIKESKRAGNIMVGVKLTVVFIVLVVGVFYIDTSNWSPFAPNGYGSILKGVSAVFFAYIGFDAVSTTAEECKNPQRDLPKAMLYSLLICTILYVLVCMVLTGMVNYKELGVGDPLAYVFGKVHLPVLEKLVAVSAVFAMGSVFLVFQLGQPRIWMAMSRDGLLPARFGKIHPKYKTPVFSSVVAGFVVAIPSLFMNLTQVTDLCSIGTLFAFALVSGGILLLEEDKSGKPGFKVPFINGQYITPILFIATLALFAKTQPNVFDLVHFQPANIPYYVFFVIFGLVSYYGFIKKWSLIPVLGLVTNLYLMTELGIVNWTRFGIWCVIGFIIYFAYGYKKSKLNKAVSQ